MQYLGKAKLVETKHSTGITVKSWDLTPWGGPQVFMGPLTQPLPPSGSTVDRGEFRIDVGDGRVWQLEEGDPPPTASKAGAITRPSNMLTMVLLAAAGWFFAGLLGLRRRR